MTLSKEGFVEKPLGVLPMKAKQENRKAAKRTGKQAGKPAVKRKDEPPMGVRADRLVMLVGVRTSSGARP